MRVLLDTNVLMDCVAERMGFAENAKAVLRLCMEKKIEGCIAAHSVMNLFYILRKHLSLDERRRILLQFCKFLSVVKIDKTLIVAALQNDAFKDVEDCLQSECAKAIAADYIVTRNVKDFADSHIPAIPPSRPRTSCANSPMGMAWTKPRPPMTTLGHLAFMARTPPLCRNPWQTATIL